MLPDTERLTESLTIRVTPGLRTEIKALAEAMGWDESKVVRVALKTHFTPQGEDPVQVAVRAIQLETVVDARNVAKKHIERALAEALAELELAERKTHRARYERGELTEEEKDTRIHRELQERGDFQAIDHEQAQPSAPRAPSKVARKKQQREAQDVADLHLNGTAGDKKA